MRSYAEEEGEGEGEGEGEEQFFDSREEMSSVSDCCSDFSQGCSCSGADINDGCSHSSGYEVWDKNPESVNDRRRRFLSWMGLSLDQSFIASEELGDECDENLQLGTDRIVDNSGATSSTSRVEGPSLSTQSSVSSQSNHAHVSFKNGALECTFACKIKNLDNGTEFLVDELDQDGMLSRLRKVGSNTSLSFDEFQRTLVSSPLVQRYLSKSVDEKRYAVEVKRKDKRNWIRKLYSVARIIGRHRAAASKPKDVELTAGTRMQRVKVYPSKKQSKQLSSLYTGQDFLAHNGKILTMKFSSDGKYLASGGEDGVVRVWKVVEDDRLDQVGIPPSDPSCLYFTVNDTSKLASLDIDERKVEQMKKHRPSNSTCVVFPPKLFKVLEKPLYEFQGHSGEVLALSWSKRKFLLSSSTDKTVRLWQVGCDRCLRVFCHNNYVTCVDFNPVDDNYFISGSIDGKVRIWEVVGCQVIDYIDIKEIVTAVCYRPGGKGAIVGSMTGDCLFYNIIDNQLRLDSQVCLRGKKKFAGKRITGFEFSPSDPSKVIVTSADSLVRVLCGMDVVCKFRASGLRTAASQISASFTSDGKHIVTTTDDSNVHIWNNTIQERSSSHVKTIKSYESFSSQNATIAIPWCGIETVPGTFISPTSSGDILGCGGKNVHTHRKFCGELDHKMPYSSPDCLSLTRSFFSDTLTKGTATWPEEKLPGSSPLAVSSGKYKSELKVLKNACQSMFSSHLWGLVIVTAGLDGRIRTYLNYGLPLRL